MNRSLDFTVNAEPESDNEEYTDNRLRHKDVHMRVSAGMADPTKDINLGHFTVVLECDERLSPRYEHFTAFHRHNYWMSWKKF